MINIQKVRADFPLISQGAQKKVPLAYLDNAATTQKPVSVINSINTFYETGNANIHRGIYDLAQQATQNYEIARTKVKNLLHAANAHEVVFTRGTTESINLVMQAFLAPRLRPNDEVVVSAMEHHSNLVPWQVLCKQCGARLRIAPINDKGEVLLDEYAQMLTEKTKMVALVHISNTLGTVNPIDEMTALAKKQQIPVLIDGAQSVSHRAINVQALNCDFFVFSGHKMYAPTGIGVLYGKAVHLEAMLPYQYGGEMIQTVTYEQSTFNRIPQKFEAGTPNIAGAIALGVAIDYIQTLGLPNIDAHLKQLLEYATQKLSAIDGVKIVGTASEKSSIISFLLDEVHPHDIGTILNESGVAIRAGHHCTMPLMRRLGVPGTARASFGVYNTLAEVDQLVEALLKVQKIFKSL
ncbi:aminotransferase class V-fold PLP-dependent enzyme [Microscilla marina]|uniref:Cysteine desulfurase n=1 Tax=Microscilla marina ATCC 23134 TaxID=313606 RepID=A1ZSC7_MICM2|nr:cysteine desulfurase [Microscilla marina]EAY26675.1 cysteine desulphurases, SufS [Microscilla marina ATCC 23134]